VTAVFWSPVHNGSQISHIKPAEVNRQALPAQHAMNPRAIFGASALLSLLSSVVSHALCVAAHECSRQPASSACRRDGFHLKQGVFGRLDTTSPSALTFESPGNTLAIPYVAIDSFEYSKKAAHRLGVLPAIAVGLFKQRQHKYFFRISYHEGDNPPQVAILEVARNKPNALLAQTRAPQGCKPQAYAQCGMRLD
jgi:hypothetical protein